MFGADREVIKLLEEILTRVIRLESRVCQLMYHVGTRPEGASPPRNEQPSTRKGD